MVHHTTNNRTNNIKFYELYCIVDATSKLENSLSGTPENKVENPYYSVLLNNSYVSVSKNFMKIVGVQKRYIFFKGVIIPTIM